MPQYRIEIDVDIQRSNGLPALNVSVTRGNIRPLQITTLAPVFVLEQGKPISELIQRAVALELERIADEDNQRMREVIGL